MRRTRTAKSRNVGYFAAIVTGLSSVLTSPARVTTFVSGVALASLGWQVLLVGVGAVVRTGSSRFARLTALIGNGTIAVLGVVLLAGGPVA